MSKEYRINVLLSENALRFVYACVTNADDLIGENDPRRKDVDYFVKTLGDKIDQINAEAASITEKEYALIQSIVQHNEYGERGCLDNHPWSWAVCDGSKAKAAVLGSLVKKGLANQDGRGNDASCSLTEAGKQAYLAKFGAEGTWRNGD